MSAATNPDRARLTADTLTRLLGEICACAGVDGRDPQLIKFTNNAVFRLPHARVVVRIAGSATMRVRVRKVVQVARWLATHDLPTVRLLPDIEQPVQVREHLATVWTEVPPPARHPPAST